MWTKTKKLDGLQSVVRLIKNKCTWAKKDPEDWQPQTDLWTTKDKKKVRVCDIEDTHLVNILRMLKRNAIKRAVSERKNGNKKSHWRNFVLLIFEKMDIDAERRGIDWENTHVLD